MPGNTLTAPGVPDAVAPAAHPRRLLIKVRKEHLATANAVHMG